MNWFNRKKKDEGLTLRKVGGYSEAEIREAMNECCQPKGSESMSLSFASLLRQTYSYRSLSAVYGCIEIISNALASMPLRVLREDEHGHREFVKHHPLQRIFNNKNIQMMSVQSIIKSAVQDVLIHGNGYILIDRGETGLINSLRYIPAGQVSIEYNQADNTLYYWISLLDKDVRKVKYSPREVIHITKDTRDGITGVPVSLFAKSTMDLTKSAEEAAKEFFDTGMNVSGLLVPKTQMNDKQRSDLRGSWNQTRTSIQVLPSNVEYIQLGVDSEKGQLLASRQYQTVEICRFYGVPAQFLQSADKVTYTAGALEQMNLIFFQQTLLPFMTSIETEFTRKLFYDDDELMVDMDESAFLLRTDKNTTSSYLSTLVGGGIMTVNEARKELNLSEMGDEANGLHIAFSDASKAQIDDNKINQPNDNDE